jgi:hypothetical protein
MSEDPMTLLVMESGDEYLSQTYSDREEFITREANRFESMLRGYITEREIRCEQCNIAWVEAEGDVCETCQELIDEAEREREEEYAS